jgi:TM2 domain-containing membrane protein YozV
MESSSERSRLVAVLFCFFLGWLGVHRFYLGKIGSGILMVVTLGGFGIWVLIDLVLLVCGAFRDKEGHKVFKWFEEGSV